MDNLTLSACPGFLFKAKERVNPVKSYDNFKGERLSLLKENRGKAGVYCLVNLINGNMYIGSSITLSSRFSNYLNNAYLKQPKNANMPLIRALFKYGQHNFAVLIVEYVDPNFVNIRETHWITTLSPYYNVLKQGYSSLGYKHSEATKKRLSELARNRELSDETKDKISKALIGSNNHFYGKSHSLNSKLLISKAKSAHPVYIYNSYKGLEIIYPSVRSLSRVINSNSATINKYIETKALFRGEWYFSCIPFHLSDVPLIQDEFSTEAEALLLEIKNSSPIKKAVFLFDLNNEFLCKYEGVVSASKELNIAATTIRNCANKNKSYKGFIFSYERLI